jgi:Vitamin K-dependent gamma-carboxylase
VKSNWLTEERETYVLGLLRVGMSVLLFLQTGRRALELHRGGYFGDFFHVPLLPDSLVPSAPVYTALLALALLGSALSALGVFARPALFSAALIGLYCMLCDRLQYHNNRYQLLLLSALVAITPCDRSFLILRPARPGAGPRWAVRLVAAQVSLVYLASGLGKLLDPDWRGGTVMLLRFGVGKAFLAPYAPASLLDLLSATWFAELASVVAITTELFLALGLWSHRTRPLALWLGVLFHLGVELAATVELFSYTMLCGYLAFVTPELRQRSLSWDTTRPLGRRLFKLFERLDLLARFEHGAQRPGDSMSLLAVRARDGQLHQGLAAWRALARAMPPLFPLWLPLAPFERRRHRDLD